MAEALIPLIATAITAAVPAITGVTVIGVPLATIIAYTVVIAASLAVSLALAKNVAKPKTSAQQQTIKQAIPPRRYTYGRDKVAGAWVFSASDAYNTLHRVLVFGQGPWDGVEATYVNDQAGAGDMSAGTGLLPYNAAVMLQHYLGVAGAPASSILTAAFPTRWTASHKLSGLAYTVMRCLPVKAKFFATVYPQGVPDIRVLARGRKVYDPRTGLTAWSENPALIIRDYLISPDGFGLAAGAIDDTAFAAFANVCDQPVALSGGGTEPRYRLSMTFDLTSEPRAVLSDMLRGCNGAIALGADSRVTIRGGVWVEPTVTIGPDNLVTPYYEYTTGAARRAAFNRLKITFKDPANDYQPVELEPWEDAASQAAAGVLTSDLSLLMVTSWRQARRLAKIHMAESNPLHRLTVAVTYAAALRAWGEGAVRLTIPELGLADVVCRVEGAEMDLAAQTGRVTLASITSDAWDWTTAEEGTPPTDAADLSAALTPPTPTGLALSLQRTEITAGTYQVRIRATVAAPATEWETIGRYREQGAVTWIDMTEDGAEAVISGVVEDGTVYEVQAAHAGLTGAESTTISTWCTALTITATADPNAPAAPPTATVAKAGTTATVSWTAPNSANYAAMRVYRHTSNVPGSATLRATVYGSPSLAGSWADTGLANGTYYWWIVPINASGTAGAYKATTPTSIVIP